MGNSGSTPAVSVLPNSTTLPPPSSGGGVCPVTRKQSSEGEASVGGGCPMKFGSKAASSSSTNYKNPVQYNVYSQPIDPTNQMPSTASQQKSTNQNANLPTERVISTIPKGGTVDQTWLYPSPQMFWNALVRKNKTDGANEHDMETVVAIHNNMNENTWRQVLAWEALHSVQGGQPGTEPKLLRFMGRPDELSPKARLKILLGGHTAPFDRHDWIVDRGGKEVRYVIDYYHDEASSASDQAPRDLMDMTSMQSTKVDVRPALDSTESLIDRLVYMPIQMFKGDSNYNPPPFFPTSQMIQAEALKDKRIARNWDDIKQNCKATKDRLTTCKSEDECGAAAVALQLCIAGVVCPSVAKDFDTCVKMKPANDAKTGAAFNKMVKCIELFEVDTKFIQQQKANS